MSGASAGGAQLTAVFGGVSGREPQANDNKAKSTKPFSIRLTDDERAYLESQAGSRPLGAYIRQKLLGEKTSKRRALRKPSLGDKQHAELLAALGGGRWSPNLNQLAKHANIGTLDVSQDVEQELHDACGAVLAMRDAFLMALNLKTGAGR